MNFFKTFAGTVTGAGTAVVAAIFVSLAGMTGLQLFPALVFGAVAGMTLALFDIYEPQGKGVNAYMSAGMALVIYVMTTATVAMSWLGVLGALLVGLAVGLLCPIAESFNKNGK